ncbi:hypothetical protein NX801_16390 [Streptomyces sp. LP05-1]|uniref:Uncharacterized protein n=1 Tax=Streptomyces pyxinae TaxID=2970734 RepID=A0ABT2CIH9_9ACTN|nr:hypothetical protein [Streptomyces sp. LP05-1]MCS0637212.1 hypothetical protein [Streptomyces sp. LP05-1]
MTFQNGGNQPRGPLDDRISALLDTRPPLDRPALLSALRDEFTACENAAYRSGWNDALAELRRRS